MFEIESKKPEEIKITTKETSVVFNIAEFTIDGNLSVGKIQGPGEFEIGNVTIRGIAVEDKTMYDVEVGGVHIGILGDIESGLEDLGMTEILCTSSVKAIREVNPKLVIATGNIDGMVTELKLAARTEKKLKIKNAEALPATLEVVALN